MDSYNDLVTSLTTALLHSIWQLAVGAVFLAIARVLISEQRSTLRYLVGCFVLVFQLAAPVFTFVYLERPEGPVTTSSAATLSTLSHTTWIPLAWALGVLLMLLRVAFGLWRIRRIERSASKLEDHWIRRFDALAAKMQISRPVRWLATSAISVPMTAGVLRPVVLLPIWTLTGIPVPALELIIAHELAHIRRFDYAINILQSLVEAIYFFHPGVWWVSAKVRDEREACCDDVVVAQFHDRLAYARALTCLEEFRADAGGLVLASSGGSFMQRIQRLFERNTRDVRGPLFATILLAALIFTGTALAEHLKSATISLPWLPPAIEKHRSSIERAALQHDVDANLLAVMVLVESGGDPAARSPSGARGLLQVMPKTAAAIAAERGMRHSEDKLDDPAYNLDLGAWYLSKQLSQFGRERPELGIAAYNGGPEQVRGWLSGKRVLSEETAHYQALVSKLSGDDSSLAYADWRSRARERSAALSFSPVKTGKVSFAYGPQTHPMTKQPYVHEGIDLAAADGTPVTAPLDGIVKDVSADPKRGNVVVVRHRGGIETSYHHLGSVAVRAEQRLTRGDLLGTVGTSGETTGPHVHFEVRDLGETIDPRPFIK